MVKTKKTRRSQVKNASLKKQYNSRIRQEYLDLDYLDQLDDTVKNCQLPDGTMVTQLQYMSLFMKEWNNAGVGKQSEAHKNKFHRTKEDVKSCTDRNNARNRDEYGIAKARNLVYRMENNQLSELIEEKRKPGKNYTEDAMIELLDKTQYSSNTADNTNKKRKKT